MNIILAWILALNTRFYDTAVDDIRLGHGLTVRGVMVWFLVGARGLSLHQSVEANSGAFLSYS